ncbi:MAG TPA: FAD-dependent oxidoreductase [Chloroflexota bacterium]|nr:FAD-dependent oxidoreductase [Chloroflexota bacterium]
MTGDSLPYVPYVPYAADLALSAEYDVIVAGGGAAGVVAAIQAARAGARTALVEKNGILGGTAVVAAVNFPGLFHAWGRQIIAGIGWEILEETVRRGGAVLPDFSVDPGRAHWRHQIRVNRFVYATVLDDLCRGAGVTLRFYELPAAVRPLSGDEAADGLGRIGRTALVVAGKTGLEALATRTLVDATGDADLAGLMGYPRRRSEHLQPGTLIYELDGYDLARVDLQALAARYAVARARGEILPTDHTRGEPPLYRELASGGGSCNHVLGIDGATSAARTAAELKGRQAVLRVYRLLRQVPGCESLRVSFVANECGIRETRRIVGEREVTVARYASGYVWEDAICYSFYPIDVHQPDSMAIDIRPLARGVVPTIPYGALIPAGSDRLLVAGRCIAGDQEANSAYRVQATCMATGQAAGAAAALAAQARGSVRAVDVPTLRALLRAHGAIVPDLPTETGEPLPAAAGLTAEAR